MGDPFAPIAPAPVAPVAQSTTALIPPPLTPIAPPVTQSNGPLDQLGRFLFGQGAAPVGGFDPVAQPFAQAGANLFGPGGGGLLGDVPVIGNIGRAIGPIAGGTLGAVIKPFEAVATVASHIPTGFLPGGADEKFAQMGDWMKANRPADYAQWEVTNAAANADVLGGGNMKADFTRKWGTDYLNETKAGPTGFFAENPGLGLTASGSLGGGLMDALGIAGLFGQKVQKAIGGIEVAGGVTRVQQVLDRATANMDLNPIEQQVVDHLKDGSWTVEHAQNFIVEQGQGLSRDFIPQMLGSIGTDPLTFAMGGSSIALKVGKAGEAVIEAGQGARGALQTLQVVTKEVQASALAPVFKVGRSLVDPFSVLSKSTVTQGAVDLAAGAATKAIDGIYGAGSRSAAFETAARRGITTELQSSLGAYSANLARKFVVTSFRATAMLRGVGAEKIAEVVPDSMIETLMKVAPTDVVTRLKDYGYGVRKVFMGNPADDQQLVGRLAAAFGGSTDGWVADVAKMSSEEKSLWHATTYAQSFKKFDEALANVGEYHGPLPLGRAVILNDHNLDNVSAEAIVTLMDEVSGSGVRKAWGEVLATLRKKGPVGDVFNPETGEIIVGATKKARIAFAQEKLAAVGENVTARAKVWNDAAAKYSDIADLGRAQPSKLHLDALVRDLQDLIDSGHLHRRVTLEELQAEPALKPLLDFLDAHNIGGEQLWNIGFRPDDFHAWGFARDRATGLLRVASDPYVSNVVDAVPAVRPINDIARNFMGQIIGPVAAGKIVKPIEAMEVAIRTAADVVSGQRLLMNMEQRFTANISKLGVAGKDAKALFRAAKEAAQLQQTTIQGLLPVNVWKAVEDIIPLELKGVVTQRAIMDSLLDASNGDLRIMGITSGFTQRVRTMLQVHGLPDNYAGQATVNFYRMVRYSLNPTFYIQRVTDGIYFNILKGIAPVWTGRALKEGSPLWQAEQVLAKIGETSIARDFGMDMREYQLLSDFQVGLRTRLGTAAGGRLEGIATAGGRWQINNQIANIHAQLGNIVKESLDEARGAYEKLAADTTLSAAERQGYRNALDATNTYDSIAAQYSAAAGRTLSPNEIGLKYIQEIFHDSLGQKLTPEGYLEYRHDIIAGTYHKPADIGELQTLSLEHLAADLGYVDRKGLGDVNALRRDISPTGQRSTEWVRERLREDFSADPDYINRAVSALTFDWNREWKDIAARLKLTARQSARLQGVVAREAIGRGMKPAEYMSQVLKTNLGGTDLDTHLGKLLSILTDKSVSATPEGIAKLTDVFMSTIDLSGQRTLVNGYMAALEGADGLIQKAYDAGDTALGQQLDQTLKRLKGGTAASGGAMKPNAPAAVDTKAVKDAFDAAATARKAADDAAAAATKAASAAPVAAAGSKVTLGQVVGALKSLASSDQAIATKLANAARVGTLPDMAKWLGDVYGLTSEAEVVAFAKAYPQVFDRLAGVSVGGSVRRSFDMSPLSGVAPGRGSAAKGAAAAVAPDYTQADALLAKAQQMEKDAAAASAAHVPPESAGTTLEEVKASLGIPDREVDNPPYLFRAISEEDYQNILKTGKMQSDGRMNLSQSEGTVAAGTDPSWYLPGQLNSNLAGEYPGRIIKIKNDPSVGWYKDRDGYWKTQQAVPSVHIVGSTPLITTNVVIGPRIRTLDRFFQDMGVTTDAEKIKWREAYASEISTRADGVEIITQGNTPESYIRQTDFKVTPAIPPAARQDVAANLADLVARRAAGEAIGNPDVEAIVRQFAKWSKETIGETLSKSGAAAHWISGLSKNIPIDGAFVYNRSEALVEQLLRQKVVLAQRDAFRLAEMSSQRTVASRSLNHPVFGLYPTSYMWGKVFPEMVKFLAQNPFGFEGAQGAYLMAKVQMAIAVQREYDPNFGTAMDALANSPTAFLVDYLTPSLPYSDMTAVTPPWARAMAKSGFDPGKMAEAEFRTIDPRRWASMFGQAGTEIVNTAKDMLSPKQQVPTVGPGALDNLISQPTQPKAQASQSSGAIGGLTAPLGNAMDELTTLFSH